MAERKAIGERVKRARMHAGLTQADLAARTGLSVSFVCMVESGARGMTLETLSVVAKVLNVRAGYLLGEDAAKEQALAHYYADALNFAAKMNLTPDQMRRWIAVGRVLFERK